MPTNAPRTRDAVTAIIIAHDGAHLLPGLVRALKAQTHPVERALGVDTASRDGSKAVLADLIGQDAVFGVDRSTGFGESVATALRHAPRQRSGQTGPSVGRAEWIWLLHDDCEPAPEALERLLRAAGRDRAVVVVGPKVLDAQDRRTLREVGVSIDRAGRRVTGIDPGEIDQGQHDHKRAMLAVSSAGMLVRRDVWDRLGGFDPNLKFFRDDVDFCWRVQAAGGRVHVATDAVLYHGELAGRRRRKVQGGSVRVVDQRNALFVLAVNLPLAVMFRVVGGCVLGSLARAFYFLLTKQLDLSAAYALSVLGLFAHPVRLLKGRRRRAAGLAEGYYAVRIFIPPARTLAKLAEQIAGLASSATPGGRHQATAEEPEEDAQLTDRASVARRIIGNPGVQLFCALLLITLIATRRLLGTSPLGGGALVPAWGGALALWQEYLAGFHAVSVGSSASTPPYLAVVALLATLLGGQARLAVDVLLLGCVPLAGVTAYLATRAVVTATPARVLLAASYALLPVAVGAVAAGRLGTAAAYILLPLIAVRAGRMLTAAARQGPRAAWAAGLLIGIAAAFAPLTWVLGVVFAVAAFGVRRWFAAVDPVNAAIVAVTPFFVLFPWSLHLLSSPSAFLLEAGLAGPNLTTHGLSATALLALSPGGPGLPPAWVTAGFALALVALVLPARRPAVLIGGWAVAVTGLLAAVLISRVTVTPSAGGQPAAGWPGVATALTALGLLLASAPAAQWLSSIIRGGSGTLPSAASASGRGQRFRRLLAGVALIGAATAPLSVAVYWVKDGVRGPVGSVSGQLLPVFISASSTSGAQYRTLVLRPGGAGLDYQVVRQGDPSLGEPELGTSAAAEAVLSRQVAALGARDGADAGDPGLVLGSFGIRWVMLPAPVDPVLASRLDGALGLVALNKGPSYDLWQVTGPVGQVRVVASSGATTVLSSATGGMSGAAAPVGGGTLILAEPYGGWTATLNGRALKPVTAPVGGWAQGFVLPPGGGQLSITYNGLPRMLSLILELVATLTVIAAALPGKRADPAEEAEALAALREARAGAAARRASGAGRPQGGAGHRTISGADRPGLARGRRAGRTPADGGPPRSLDPVSRLPAEPGAGPAEPASTGAAATASRTERGHGRHRGAHVGTGGLPAAPRGTADDEDSPAPALARQTGRQPAVPEPSGRGTGSLDMPGSSAADAGQRDGEDWLQELLRNKGAGQQSSASAPAVPESPRGETDPLDLPEGAAANAGGEDDPDRQPATPESRAADALDTSRALPGTERPDDPAQRKTSGWKGAFTRMTGQQPAMPENPKAESAPGTSTPPADAERRDASDWLDELLRENGVGRPSAAAETATPAPSRRAADPLDTSGPSADAGRRDDSGWPDALARKDDQARRSGRHAAAPGASPEPPGPGPAFPPRESPRPESPAPGNPAPEAPAREPRPPRGTGPQRAPWDSGPQDPVPAAGPQPGKPRESGPQGPATSTGAQPASPADARPAWGTRPLPAARTGAQPTFTPTGPQPAVRPTGAQPTFMPSGPQPTFTPTGPQPTFTPAGGQAAFRPARTAPPAGPGTPPAGPGTPPAGKAPREPGDRDTSAGSRDAVPATGGPGDGNRPAASPLAKPERHSRRGGKHGKPSRWRGSGSRSEGNRSSGDRES